MARRGCQMPLVQLADHPLAEHLSIYGDWHRSMSSIAKLS